MIEVITPSNRHLHSHTLLEMFKLRYRMFIQKYGWKVACPEPGIDRDQFDTDDTTYLVRSLPDGTITAACRFNQTTKPHMLSTVFRHYCDFRGPAVGENIYECSRLVFNELDIERRELIRARGEFMYAIVEFCMRVGIEKISWMTYEATYQRYIRFWPSQPLGFLHDEDDATYGAAVSKMNDEALRNMAGRIDIPQPLLRCVEEVPIVPMLLVDRIGLTPPPVTIQHSLH